MNKIKGLILLVLVSNSNSLWAKKQISEATLTYDIVIKNAGQAGAKAETTDKATTTIYLKSGVFRSDMSSALGNETTIHRTAEGDAIILKEYSGQKLMIKLSKDNWLTKNRKYEGVEFNTSSEQKLISGYHCLKATATLKDGTTVEVYYTKDIAIQNKEYDPLFKNLPGLPVQYDFKSGNMSFSYALAKIDFSGIPALKFDYPKTGYRVITYDENSKGQK